MALIKCEECGENISNNANNCPHCGNPNTKNEKITSGLVMSCIFSFLIPILGLIFFFAYKSKSQQKSNMCIICAIFGFLFGIIIYIFLPALNNLSY